MVYQYTRPRGPIGADFKSPGPAVYVLPPLCGNVKHDPRSTHAKKPAWPFGNRCPLKEENDNSPGPIYPAVSDQGRFGRATGPSFSLLGKNQDLSPTGLRDPGPAAYNPTKAFETTQKKNPLFSFGRRVQLRRIDDKPPPNIYSLDPMLGPVVRGDKPRAPCHSLHGRLEHGSFCEDTNKTPGPGTYPVGNYDAVRKQAPAFSIKSRVELPRFSHTRNPGPGSHNPQNVLLHMKGAPRFSFGIRHSEHEMPVISDNYD